MQNLGFPCILNARSFQDEAQALYRRLDYFDPEGARSWCVGPEICTRHGVEENTVYRWKSEFGGRQISEAKRLRELEAEFVDLIEWAFLGGQIDYLRANLAYA